MKAHERATANAGRPEGYGRDARGWAAYEGKGLIAVEKVATLR